MRIKRCCVPGCSDKTVPRHHIPTDPRCRDIWIERVGNPKLYGQLNPMFFKSYLVCENHFARRCMDKNTGRLLRYSLPTLRLPGYRGPSTRETSFNRAPVPPEYVPPEKIREALRQTLSRTPSSLAEDEDSEIRVRRPAIDYSRKRPSHHLPFRPAPPNLKADVPPAPSSQRTDGPLDVSQFEKMPAVSVSPSAQTSGTTQSQESDDEANEDEGNKEKEPIRNEDIVGYPITYTEKHSDTCKNHQACQKAFKVWFQYSLTKYGKTGFRERLIVNRSEKTCDMYFESNTGVRMAEELRKQTEIGEPPSSAIPGTQGNDETGPAENEPNALPTRATQIGVATNEKTSADDVWLVPETAAKTLLMFETEDLGAVEERNIGQDTTDDEYKVMKKVLIKGLHRLPIDSAAGDESSSVHVCRICLDSVIPAEEAVALSLESPATVGVANETGEMKDLSVLDMISVVLPRMQMKPNMKTVLCENCVVSLHTSYQLKMRWIETEIKLQAYLEQKNLSYDVEYELPGSSMECQKSEESQANIQDNATLQEETVDSPDGVLPDLSAPSPSEQPPMTGEQSEHSPNTELNNEPVEWQFCELDPTIILSSNLKRFKWGGGPYLCSECGKVFQKVKSFQRHVIGSCDNSSKTKVCEFCGLVFANKSKFFKHRQRHSTKNRCSTCSKVLCSKQALEAHVNNIHLATSKRRAQCEQCGKTLKKKLKTNAFVGSKATQEV